MNILFKPRFFIHRVSYFGSLVHANNILVYGSEEWVALAEVIDSGFGFMQLSVQERSEYGGMFNSWAGYFLQVLIRGCHDATSQSICFVTPFLNRCQASGLILARDWVLLTCILWIVFFDNLNILFTIGMHIRQDVNTWHVNEIVMPSKNNVTFRRNLFSLIVILSFNTRRTLLHFMIIKCLKQVSLGLRKNLLSILIL